MSRNARYFLACSLLACLSVCHVGAAQQTNAAPQAKPQAAPAQPKKGDLTVVEIRSLLSTIDPYLPEAEVTTEVDVFGSTSMDALAHGWVFGFTKFHPKAKVIISAEGSETVFARLAKNPASIGMLSRPVTQADLDKLKSLGLQNPVAVHVARDAMGVYVHESNPLKTITYEQLAALLCADENPEKVTWSAVGVEGKLADQPVQIYGRGQNSGTHTFVNGFLFHGRKVRPLTQDLDSNADVLGAIAKNPQAIGLAELKVSAKSVKRLGLQDKTTVFDGNEHDVLMGNYPIIRPLTLVFDLGQKPEAVAANREFARYALTQTGQTQAILAGFFPFDPPTLRSEMSKLKTESSARVADAEPDKEGSK